MTTNHGDDYCPWCHQAQGTHDADCDCRFCTHDCDTDCPHEDDTEAE